MAECVSCGDDFNPKRYRLGYRTCLECGQTLALQEKVSKSRGTAILVNKSAYQYITNVELTKSFGR